MRVNECEVWITCEGGRLPEYDTQPGGEDGKTLACFIPSEAGKNFAVEWHNTSADYLRFSVKLDGTSAGGARWCEADGKDVKRGIRVGPSMLQPFQFSNLMTTDADDALHVPSNTDLGTIYVKVHQMQLIRKLNTRERTYNSSFQSVGPVHERSKKAGVHCVTLGEAIEVEPIVRSKYRSISKIIHPERPVAEFLFRYRPLALLQAQDIVPLPARSPAGSSCGTGQDRQDDHVRPIKRQHVETAGSDNSGEVDVKPDIADLPDDDEDELGILKGQLSQIMDRINRMEQKKKQRKDAASPTVKKEEPSASSSRLRAGSDDVIDLTLSD